MPLRSASRGPQDRARPRPRLSPWKRGVTAAWRTNRRGGTAGTTMGLWEVTSTPLTVTANTSPTLLTGRRGEFTSSSSAAPLAVNHQKTAKDSMNLTHKLPQVATMDQPAV